MYMGNTDFRYVKNGYEMPSENYCDQPRAVKAENGAWVCVLTTGTGVEGQRGQHIVCNASTDYGKTWTHISDVEPADGPEASYAVLLKAPGGRLFCFYNHNSDDLRYVLGDPAVFPGGKVSRVDSQGHFVFKFSDDHGATWSDKRYDIPIRTTEIDKNNPYRGKIKYFWNVGNAFLYEGTAYVPLTKVGGFGRGFFIPDEGVLLCCENFNGTSPPETFIWTTRPDGDAGLRAPAGGGLVSEEHNYAVLSDGSFYSVYRTTDGLAACAYSRDKGRSWPAPAWKRYADGRLMRNPRGPNFCWKCENGKYLYWYYNNGSNGYGGKGYSGRNPVWLAGGVETDSPDGKVILWSQGEILLYDDDPAVGMGYPDLLEQGGRYFVTETDKHTARIHEIPSEFLENLWNRHETDKCKKGLIGEWTESNGKMQMPVLPDLHITKNHSSNNCRTGFTIDIQVEITEPAPGTVIFDSRDAEGAGILISINENASAGIQISDNKCRSSWSSDAGTLKPGLRSVAFIIDNGPKLIIPVIDGIACDGNGKRIFGYGRYNTWLSGANGADEAIIGAGKIRVKNVRIYGRALMITELIGNHRHDINNLNKKTEVKK